MNAWLLRPLPFTAPAAQLQNPVIGSIANLGNDYAGVVCAMPGINGSAPIRIDLGSDQPVDTVMLFGLSLAPASALLRMSAWSSTAGPFAGDPTWTGDQTVRLYAGDVMPAAGSGTSLVAMTAPACRYWQIEPANLQGTPVQLSRIVIGRRIQLERNFSYGGSAGVRDLGSLDFSARGVLLRRRGRKLRTVQLTFSSVRKDEVEALTGPLLLQLGNTEMVALVTDPAEDPQRQNRCYFGPLVGDLGHTRRNAVAFEAKVNLVSIF